MNKIMTMTDEQKALMDPYAQKWIEIGMCTDPADRPRAEAAVRECYRLAKIPMPPRIVWVQSDWVGAFAAMIAESIWRERRKGRDAVDGAVRDAVDGAVDGAVGGAVDGAVGGAVGGAVYGAVDDAVRGAVRGAVGDAVGDAVGVAVGDAVDGAVYGAKKKKGKLALSGWHYWYGGQMWAYFAAYSGFMRDVLKVALPTSAYHDLAESCGHVWFNRDFVIICERIKACRKDERGRLHNESGLALEYRDGTGLWMIHGVRVSGDVVMNPESLTVERVDKETNSEVRRIMIERMGLVKYLRESNAKTIHMDALTIPGSAPRALIEDRHQNRWLAGTDGSTGRVYIMPVPREAKTCSQAHNLIAGFDESRLIAEA